MHFHIAVTQRASLYSGGTQNSRYHPWNIHTVWNVNPTSSHCICCYSIMPDLTFTKKTIINLQNSYRVDFCKHNNMNTIFYALAEIQ